MNEEELYELAWRWLRKEDIVSVQRVMDALYPILETWWLQAIEDALRRGDLLLGQEEITSARLSTIDALSGKTPDGRQRFEIEALLTRSYMRTLEQAVSSLPPSVEREVDDGINALFLTAAAHWSLPGAPPTRFSASMTSGAFQDLSALLEGRIGSRRGDVQHAVQELVRVVMQGQATEVKKDELIALLGLTSMRQWLDFSLDMWAYRWFNMGILADAQRRGFRFFKVVNNPPIGPDQKTTPFCRSIHDTVINIEHALKNAQSYVDAAVGRDYDAMRSAWPMLTGNEANDTSIGSDERHRANLRRLGLPPYHPKCRTVVMPVRFS